MKKVICCLFLALCFSSFLDFLMGRIGIGGDETLKGVALRAYVIDFGYSPYSTTTREQSAKLL